jgi:hypothetical protein
VIFFRYKDSLRLSWLLAPSYNREARSRCGERMHEKLAVVVGCAALIACAPDTVHAPISLPPPYAALPAASPATPIERGQRFDLNARQQRPSWWA